MVDLPQGWTTVRFEQVVEVNPKKAVDLPADALVTFVPMAAIDEVSGLISNPVQRPLSEVDRGFTQFVERDVLFAKITPSMENGKSAVARDLVSGTGFGSTEFHVLRSYGAVLPKYIWRYVRQQGFRDNAQRVMSGAVGQQRVPAEYLKLHPIPLPPLAEQQRIVDKLDDLIGRTERAGAEVLRSLVLLGQYKSRLLENAYSGKIIGKKVLGFRPLGEFDVTLKYGTAKKSYENIDGTAVLRIPNVKSGTIDLSDLKYSELTEQEQEKLRLEIGDVLVVRSNGSPELVGRPAVVPDKAAGLAYAGYLIRIRPDTSKLLPDFLAFMLQAPQLRAVIESGVRSTSGVYNINARELSALPIPVLSVAEQKKIVVQIKKELAWLDRIELDRVAVVKLLPKLENALLAKAFRGELVEQISDDEPAVVTLARVASQRSLEAAKPKRDASRFKPRGGDTVKTATPKTLEEVLADAGDWLDAQVAFLGCGLSDRSTIDDVEELYAQLRRLDVEGRLDSCAQFDDQGRKISDKLRLKAV